jgi:serine/threonine protein kinase/tetratricopeptide (TPR) repeat protein
MVDRAKDFAGSERFTVERCLGAGGFGTVYQVYDRQRRTRVALKMLHRTDPVGLLGLKREFRALADLSHPNLASLYELLSEEDGWFISMELVAGAPFVDFVHGTSDSPHSGTTGSDDLETGAEILIAPRPQLSLTAPDVGRLENSLQQLAYGLRYLHSAGRLHRDIKPSNVLVTPEGRVVVLDFGLVTEVGVAADASGKELSGTPAYMAPMRGADEPYIAADDWYSVGVMMFEALTGTLPFTGGVFEVMLAKTQTDAPSPSALVPAVPTHLDDLCRLLLSRDPGVRLQAASALLRLGSRPATPAEKLAQTAVPSNVPLVGRNAHLAALAEAYDTAKAGHSVSVYVHGSSGMGKTALVRRFLQTLNEQDPAAIVLTGRCFERESVPYKALDSIVDALSEYLRSVPREQADALLPRDVLALARVFPVLRRVDAVVNARHRVLNIPDALELRRRAFAAFRELLARLGSRQQVVVFIDDLQWGDDDSGALLMELLRQPDAPAVLFIASYRTEEVQSSVLLRRLLPGGRSAAADNNARDIVVAELEPAEARELANVLTEGESSGRSGDALVRDAGGNPFLINELARYAKPPEHGGKGAETDITLDDVILDRVTGLPEPARRLLEVLAVFGQPVDRGLASRAAGLESEEMESVALLRAERLSRARVMDDHEELETYHDRIRETVIAHLDPSTLRSHHRALARALETVAGADPEALAVHFQGAGEQVRAARYALAAADRATDALAFDRAARLYRTALDLDPAAARDTRRNIEVKLGEALASAGRGGEAARAYLAAAADAETGHQLELRRRAAEQFLRSGHFDEGFETIRTVLAAIGMSLAKSPRRALLSMVIRRMRIRFRGLGFRERDIAGLSPALLVRIDTCWSVAMGLGIVDNIRGADFQGRHLLLALNAGEPYRIARALGMEVAYSAVPGGRAARARSRMVGEMAQALAERVNNPQALGLISLTRGTAAHLLGDWRTALELCDRAETILRERCTGVGWELAATHLYALLSLYYLGELGELTRRLPILLQEARERDDFTAVANLRTRLSYLIALAADDAPRAREEVRQGIAVWSRKGFTAQHFFELHGLVEIALFERAGADAWAAVERSWPALKRSLLMRVQRIHIESLSLRARAAVAAAVDDVSARTRLLRLAGDAIGKIRGMDAPHAVPIATLLAAGVEATRGRHDRAEALLEEARALFGTIDMPLHAAAAIRRLGEMGLPGGLEEADAWMNAHGIRNPEAMTNMLVPGAFGRR